MFVSFANSQKIVTIKRDQVETLVKHFLIFTNTKCNEVSVNFVSKTEISQLHDVYFNDPSPTDCISFPIDDPGEPSDYCLLGEVFVCPEVALEYSKIHKMDFGKELSLYLVHGLLHLIGYDDIQENDEKIMRQMEEKVLIYLKEKKALLNVSLPLNAF